MPQVFISYSHDSPEHVDRVLALSNRLRAEGVDCRIDQYEQAPAEGWPLWCERQVEQSILVLVACTETYLRRFKGEETPQIGLGVSWEGHIIAQDLYDAQSSNTKFIPILFSKEDDQFVPKQLRSATRYKIPDNYDQLYRRLTDQPLISMPVLGGVKPMPARESLPLLPRQPLSGLKSAVSIVDPSKPHATMEVPEGVYLDLETKLMWTKEDNGKDLEWNEAKEYAWGLSLGGYKDWRLPTIEELEDLYAPGSERGYKIRNSFLLTKAWIWSSTRFSPGSGWFFSFENGVRLYNINGSGRNRVLCLRGPTE